GTCYYPTFLYESGRCIFGLILLLFLRRRSQLQGVIFLTYVISYCVGRCFIEGVRTDRLYIVVLICMAHMIAILLIVGALILMIYRRKVVNVHYDSSKIKGKKKK